MRKIPLIKDNDIAPWTGKPHAGPKRKFKRGQVIYSADALMAIFERNQYVYLHARPIHPAWLFSMQFRTVIQMMKAGVIREALPND
jgi:hypothetical protein